MNYNLNAIKDQIKQRKEEQDKVKGQLGENVSVPTNSNSFLSELLESHKTGRETNAIKKIRAVDKVAEAKENKMPVNQNEILKHVENKNPKPSPKKQYSYTPPKQTHVNEEYDGDRFGDLNKGYPSNDTIYGSIEKFNGNMNNGHMRGGGFNNNYLNEEQMRYLKETHMNQNSSAGQLNEVVMTQAKEMLNENFANLFSDALKNTIVKNFEKNKLQESLVENRDFIKNIVVEVIKELQQLNSKK